MRNVDETIIVERFKEAAPFVASADFVDVASAVTCRTYSAPRADHVSTDIILTITTYSIVFQTGGLMGVMCD